MTANRDIPPALEVRNLSKHYGSVSALEGVSTSVHSGEVTCLLGDNGAGKSSLIKILSGLMRPDPGAQLFIDGVEHPFFGSPAEARDTGVSTVYQDLALVPLLPIWRNFFIGHEPTKGRGPFRRLDVRKGRQIALAELANLGVMITDPERPVQTLSGGQRQSVATARAVYFGAKVLILDEPTAALGVRQSVHVLEQVVLAKNRGLAVILITHNPTHADLVGDRFVLLDHGQVVGDYRKGEIARDDLIIKMAAGTNVKQLEEAFVKLAQTGGTANRNSMSGEPPTSEPLDDSLALPLKGNA